MARTLSPAFRRGQFSGKVRGMRKFALALFFCCACGSQKHAVSAADQDFHQRAIVIDAHTDITEAIYYEGYDFGVRHQDHNLDLPRMREGGLDAQFFSIFVHPESVDIQQFFPEAMKEIDAVEAMVKANSNRIAMARTAGEITANAAAGKASALLGVEGGHLLLPGSEDEQLQHLRDFAARGVRYLTLSWSSSSPIGGSTAEGENEGLTPFGRRAIAEMEKLGVIIDLSHGSDPLFWDVIRIAKKPLLLTHSSSRELSHAARNASDSMLTAVARNGGAVCVDFSRTYLDDKFRKATQGLLQKTKGMHPYDKQKLYAGAKLPAVPLSTLVDHIDHMVKVAGVDHVCLGSDYDSAPMFPVGLEDVSKLPALTEEMRKRGRSDEDIEKILGGNLLRVLAATEAH
jgi:membrane dipeptidase